MYDHFLAIAVVYEFTLRFWKFIVCERIGCFEAYLIPTVRRCPNASFGACGYENLIHTMQIIWNTCDFAYIWLKTEVSQLHLYNAFVVISLIAIYIKRIKYHSNILAIHKIKNKCDMHRFLLFVFLVYKNSTWSSIFSSRL